MNRVQCDFDESEVLLSCWYWNKDAHYFPPKFELIIFFSLLLN